MSPPIGNIPSSPSPALQAVLSWMDYLTSKNFDGLSLILTEDFKHSVSPETIGLKFEKRKEEILKLWKINTEPFQNWVYTIDDIVEAPDKIAVHAKSNADTPRGPFANEYIFIFNLRKEDDGRWKISACREFVDSKYTAEWYAGVARDA
ncbi:hypothetical protein C8Q75DRAFT_616201 [Abortiporus biennis]|nr:hypothetical protein C8Q75DRAFT_616201 [Abortiporus biennis]